jgi:hypothetical protein
MYCLLDVEGIAMFEEGSGQLRVLYNLPRPGNRRCGMLAQKYAGSIELTDTFFLSLSYRQTQL